MTKSKSFKQRVRARMQKTGETYTTARQMLIAAGDRPEVVQRSFAPRISEAKVRQATGRVGKTGLPSWTSGVPPGGPIPRLRVVSLTSTRSTTGGRRRSRSGSSRREDFVRRVNTPTVGR